MSSEISLTVALAFGIESNLQPASPEIILEGRPVAVPRTSILSIAISSSPEFRLNSNVRSSKDPVPDIFAENCTKVSVISVPSPLPSKFVSKPGGPFVVSPRFSTHNKLLVAPSSIS